MAHIEQFFREADTDGSGYLTVQELTSVLQRKGYKVKDDQKIEKMFNTIDLEGDKKVSFDEYMQAMGQRPAVEHKAAHLRRVARSFDKSGDGKIDRSELKAVFAEMKSNVTDAELDRMMALADTDKSGSLDYEEFIDRVFGKQSY